MYWVVWKYVGEICMNWGILCIGLIYCCYFVVWVVWFFSGCVGFEGGWMLGIVVCGF